MYERRHWILSRSKVSCRKLFGDILLALLTSSGNSVLLHVSFRWPIMYSNFVTYLSWLEGLITSQVTKLVLGSCTYEWLWWLCMFSHPQFFVNRGTSQNQYLHWVLYLPSSCIYPVIVVFEHWPFALKIKQRNLGLYLITFNSY